MLSIIQISRLRGAALPARQQLGAVRLLDEFRGERAGYVDREAEPQRLVAGIRAWSPLDLQRHQRYNGVTVAATPGVAHSRIDVEPSYMQLVHAFVTHRTGG